MRTVEHFDDSGHIESFEEYGLNYQASDLHDLLSSHHPENLENLGPARVAGIPNRDDIVLRWNFQTTPTDFDQAREEVAWFTDEIATLRRYGVPALKHTVFLAEKSLHEPEDRPALYMVAERTSGRTLHESMYQGEQDSKRWSAIGRALVKYYGSREGRPFLTDITEREQYASDGRLMDLDPKYDDSEQRRQQELAFAQSFAGRRFWHR